MDSQREVVVYAHNHHILPMQWWRDTAKKVASEGKREKRAKMLIFLLANRIRICTEEQTRGEVLQIEDGWNIDALRKAFRKKKQVLFVFSPNFRTGTRQLTYVLFLLGRNKGNPPMSIRKSIPRQSRRTLMCHVLRTCGVCERARSSQALGLSLK